MKQIGTMIKKDIRFSGKWLIVSAVLLLLISLFFQHSTMGQTISKEWLMAAASIFGILPFLYRTFSLEDNPETRSFLRAIPILPEIQVYGKYAMTAALCGAAFVVTAAVWAVLGMAFSATEAAAGLGILFCFHSLALYVFYKAGIQLLQQCYAFFFLGLFCLGRFHISIHLTTGFLPWAILAAAMLLYGLSAKKAAWEVL